MDTTSVDQRYVCGRLYKQPLDLFILVAVSKRITSLQNLHAGFGGQSAAGITGQKRTTVGLLGSH